MLKIPPRFVSDSPLADHESLSYSYNADGSASLVEPLDVRDSLTSDDLSLKSIIETGNNKLLDPVRISSSPLSDSDSLSDQMSNLLNTSVNE